jgi:hypothetical protein
MLDVLAWPGVVVALAWLWRVPVGGLLTALTDRIRRPAPEREGG